LLYGFLRVTPAKFGQRRNRLCGLGGVRAGRRANAPPTSNAMEDSGGTKEIVGGVKIALNNFLIILIF
jgi:hypothetical protein